MSRKIEYDIERIRIRYIDHTPRAYENGRFVPIFQDAAALLAMAENLTGVDLKLMFHIISILDERNSFKITPTKVAERLHTTRQSINRSVNKLVNMKIICADEDDSNNYKLGEFVLNPRIGFWGDTRSIDKTNLPVPVDHETGEILLLGALGSRDTPDDYTW